MSGGYSLRNRNPRSSSRNHYFLVKCQLPPKLTATSATARGQLVSRYHKDEFRRNPKPLIFVEKPLFARQKKPTAAKTDCHKCNCSLLRPTCHNNCQRRRRRDTEMYLGVWVPGLNNSVLFLFFFRLGLLHVKCYRMTAYQFGTPWVRSSLTTDSHLFLFFLNSGWDFYMISIRSLLLLSSYSRCIPKPAIRLYIVQKTK